MWDLFHHPLRDEEFFGIFALICVLGYTAVVLTRSVLAHVRQAKLDEMDGALKLEMVQRGMSADEIERILHAKSVPPAIKAKTPVKV